MEEEPKGINKELRREESWHKEVKVVLRGARGTELDRDIITVLVNKELRREESWHQEVKVVLRGARGMGLDRNNIIEEKAENNVLVLKKESVMVMVNTKYKEDMFNVK